MVSEMGGAWPSGEELLTLMQGHRPEGSVAMQSVPGVVG